MNEHIKPMTGEHAAEIFAAGLTAKFADSDWPYNPRYYVDEYNKATKYLRIVSTDGPYHDGTIRPGAQRFCHAFVDRETGAVYKSAGWKGPFKNTKTKLPDVRFENVFEALVKADRHGSYLYK